MTTANEPQSTRNPLPWWIKLPIGLAVLVLLIMCTVYMAGRAATAQWYAYAASLRAKGQPLTLAEVEVTRPVIPEDKNSARIIEALIEDFPANTNSPAAYIDSGLKTQAPKHTLYFTTDDQTVNFKNGIPRYTIEAARQFLADNREILDRLSQLKDRPTGRFVFYDDPIPYNIMLPNLAPVRLYGRLLHLQTTLNLIDENAASALENIRCNFNIASSFTGEAILISRLVAIAIQALVVSDINMALNSGVISEEEHLKELLLLLETQLSVEGNMKNALLGERASFATMCEQFAINRVPVSTFFGQIHWSAPLSGPATSIVAIVRSNQIRGTELLTPLVDAADDPAALIKAAKEMEAEMPNLRFTQFIVKMLLPSLSRVAEINARSYAELRCAVGAVAAERFRLKNGRFPNSLDELVPEYLDAVPIDPFDGKPLRFLTDEDGLIIYSIHRNLTDDGGSIDALEDEKNSRDWGFRLFKPELREFKITDEPPPNPDDE